MQQLTWQTFGNPPSFGLDQNDVSTINSNTAQWDARRNAPAMSPTASLSGAASVGDLAQGAVNIDTTVPLRGFLAGLAILTVIRLFWETLPE